MCTCEFKKMYFIAILAFIDCPHAFNWLWKDTELNSQLKVDGKRIYLR